MTTWGSGVGACLLAAVLAAPGAAAAPPTGFQDKVRVSAPTRLDWKFVASAFGPDAVKVAADYDSRQLYYQLYVPRDYDKARTWPLVVFVSPGDDPLGWKYWQKTCEKAGALFCAPYAAGNSCPPGQRTRIVLDMLDDVRRHYQIDPDRTYLSGFSGGGRMACTIAFALPEYFGGVAPVCGTNPLPRQEALRHRMHDRLSVAFLTGEKDFNRKENEAYLAPLCADLGVRCRLWVVPKMQHAMPPDDVLSQAYDWMADDLARRRADVRTHPGLAVSADEAPTPDKASARQVEEAEAELKKPDHTWRGVALLRGVVERWPNSDAGDRARALLKRVVADEARARAVAEEGGKEEGEWLTAQARALERFGETRDALRTWRALAAAQPDTPAGKKAAAEAKRLAEALAATPYLGVSFEPGSLLVTAVVARGPADRAGLMTRDRLLRIGGVKVTTYDEVRGALSNHKPGDRIELEVDRGGQVTKLSAAVGSAPADE